MIQIDGVEIRYFRSIYRTRFKNLTDVVVLAGRDDDIGKFNILKALIPLTLSQHLICSRRHITWRPWLTGIVPRPPATII